MGPTWKSWCRLCAREDLANTHVKLHLEDEHESEYLDTIRKYFSIDVKLDGWPQNVCIRCHEFVLNLISFLQRTSKVQAMFSELISNLGEIYDADQLKTQYELQELGDIKLELKFFSGSPEAPFEPKPNVEAAEVLPEQIMDLEEIEYIDEDVLDTSRVKTEDENKENPYDDDNDDEWHNSLTPEQDSDRSTIVSSKCEDDDPNDKEKPKDIKRGRPRIKLNIFPCSSCPKQFVTYSKYLRHMQQTHGGSGDLLPYKCSKCNKCFSTKQAYQKHERTHITSDQKTKIPCPYCDKIFKKMCIVQNHIRSVHSGEKPFICEECGKGCKTFGALKEHKLTHTEETPFNCRYCEKSFKNKSRLKTHLDTHNETNYICTSCGLQLNTRRTLKMHMLVHSDQKRHKCDYCGNEFKRSKALKNHLILHTGLKPYTCNFCGKAFANGSNCRTHKKKSHPIELAALEASGTKIINANIPKLENLRAATSNKPISNQEPVSGSLMALSDNFGSTVSIVSIADDIESLESDNQLKILTGPGKNDGLQGLDLVHNTCYDQLQIN